MERRLDIGAAAFAFIAAVFWFSSAVGHLPPITTYWLHAPSNDPFYVAMKFSAQMNMWAAIFSGFSALCLFFRVLCGRGT
jgi:hypothetical protein